MSYLNAEVEAARGRSRRLIELNSSRGALDVSRRRAQRSCLGGAIGLEDDAIQLMLTGFSQEAREYFRTVGELAKCALDDDETYVFRGPDGGRAFARFTCLRLLATSWWAEYGNDDYRRSYLQKSREYLLEAMLAEPGSRSSTEASGRLWLMAAQAEEWTWINREAKGRRIVRADSPWAAVQAALAAVTNLRVAENDAQLCPDLESLFLDKVLSGSLLNPIREPYVRSDGLAIAEVRARENWSVEDPQRVFLSLRDGELE